MPAIQPMRSSIRSIDGGVELVIPAVRQSPLLTVLPLWLCGWLPAGLHSLTGLTSARVGVEGASLAFELPWLAVWALGVLAAVGMLLWIAFGVQRVRFMRDEVSVTREILRWQYCTAYRARDVTNLRTLRPILLLAGGGPLSEPCKLAFDYGTRTIQFASGIDDDEACRIVDRITSCVPWFNSARRSQ
jgi:hypothetical protein